MKEKYYLVRVRSDPDISWIVLNATSEDEALQKVIDDGNIWDKKEMFAEEHEPVR